MNNNRKYTFGEIVFTIVFMTWFVGSIVMMIFLARNEMATLAIGVFGQYFLVFGIAAIWAGIKSKNFNPIVLILPIVGIASIAVSVVWQFGAEETIEFIEENGWMALLALFIIVGVFMEVYAIAGTIGEKRKFSKSVTATCVDILVNYDNAGREIYCPVYETYVGGIKNVVSNNIYSTKMDVHIGDIKIISVSEYFPGECYENETSNRMGIILGILGVFFIGIPLFAFYMMWRG